jgi:glycosyltransferase involved in cell wall biosynthesis
MKIGLYGGLANNCYTFSKVLHQAGLDVVFVRDRSDCYAFSQPVWEDARLVMDYAEVAGSSAYTWEKWSRIEAENQWCPPEWLVDPLAYSAEPVIRSVGPVLLELLGRRYIGQTKHRASVVAALQTCDVLLVCGIEAAILAMMAGRPYIIWPHGGDIRLAAGLTAPPKGFRARVSFEAQRTLLRAAYDGAGAIGTHDPKGLGGKAGYVGAALRKTELVHLPMPTALSVRVDKTARKSMLAGILRELGLPDIQADVVGIVPSRVDFAWKGHDLLLRAFSRAKGREQMHLIFSGWGNDYGKAKTYVEPQGLKGCVTFLPFSLSRPILAHFFSLADFAVDQFGYMGTYGTAMVEAMAAGCPTLMWIEDASFVARGWEPPPVINAEKEDDIVRKLELIASGAIDLAVESQRSQDWIRRVHAPAAVVPVLMQRFAEMRAEAVRA